MERSEFFQRVQNAVDGSSKRYLDEGGPRQVVIDQAKKQEIFFAHPGGEEDSKNPVVEAIYLIVMLRSHQRSEPLAELIALEKALEYYEETKHYWG